MIWRSGQHHYTGEVEDTLVNGTVYMITGKVAEEKVPVTGKMRFNTKFKNWKRTKFGKQTILQTALQRYYNHQYSSAKYMLSN